MHTETERVHVVGPDPLHRPLWDEMANCGLEMGIVWREVFEHVAQIGFRVMLEQLGVGIGLVLAKRAAAIGKVVAIPIFGARVGVAGGLHHRRHVGAHRLSRDQKCDIIVAK